MSNTKWVEIGMIEVLKERIKKLKFADRLQMIQKLVNTVSELLDGMEAEVKKECP